MKKQQELDIANMFKRASKPNPNHTEKLDPENFHSYFATFRAKGHRTIRHYFLGKGLPGVHLAKVFLAQALNICDHLMLYKIDGMTGEVTAFDPTK